MNGKHVWLSLLAGMMPLTVEAQDAKPDYGRVVRGVAKTLREEHVASRPLDDQLSEEWAAEFVSRLDPRKMYFLRSDIREFRQWYHRLDGKVFDQAANSIYDAYESSDDSDGNFVFLLEIAESSTRPEGSYVILPIQLRIGKSWWPLTGYKIRAADVEGIQNGTDEIVNALKAGKTYHLEPGERKGALAAPRYKR